MQHNIETAFFVRDTNVWCRYMHDFFLWTFFYLLYLHFTVKYINLPTHKNLLAYLIYVIRNIQNTRNFCYLPQKHLRAVGTTKSKQTLWNTWHPTLNVQVNYIFYLVIYIWEPNYFDKIHLLNYHKIKHWWNNCIKNRHTNSFFSFFISAKMYA